MPQVINLPLSMFMFVATFVHTQFTVDVIYNAQEINRLITPLCYDNDLWRFMQFKIYITLVSDKG